MKFIDKLRRDSNKSIERNKKEEYKKALNEIKRASMKGQYTCKYVISLYYENKNDIYFYIIEQLRKQGFKVDIEKYGYGSSWERLCISWKPECK